MIALGTYIISSTLSTPASSVGLFTDSKIILFVCGVGLNLIGSLCWALGRRFVDSYIFAWTYYLGSLVVYGVLVSVFIEKENITYLQSFGAFLLVCALWALKK